MTFYISTTSQNASADAVGDLADSGKLRIYSGTVPADANASIGAAVLLAELTLNAAAFGAASNGVITAGAITADSTADATGTASFFRVWKSDGTTCLFQGTVGTSGADLNLNTTSIVAGGAVSVSSLTYTQPAS